MGKAQWVGQTRRTPKPWGYEDLLAYVEGRYCGKLLFIKAGHTLSLRLHERAEKTLAVQDGHLVVEMGSCVRELERFHLFPGDNLRLQRGMLHRVAAAADSQVIEASTAEPADVVGRPI
jgi:mannose-6-phosphate isomerase-like protein (cupin superfamily)